MAAKEVICSSGISSLRPIYNSYKHEACRGQHSSHISWQLQFSVQQLKKSQTFRQVSHYVFVWRIKVCPRQTRSRYTATAQNQHDSTTHHTMSRCLPQQHLFPLSMAILWVLQSACITAANICMEEFENKVIRTAENLPRFLKRYVHDTFVIQDKQLNDKFPQHISSIDKAIQFTVDDTKQGRAMTFLDTIIPPAPNGTLSIEVYRRTAYTDQYIQWDSNHHLSAKYSVIVTFTPRPNSAYWCIQGQGHYETEKWCHILV